MEDVKFMIDNLWVLMSALLVFVMHLGFSSLEVGLTRQKNTVNVLFKNLFIIRSNNYSIRVSKISNSLSFS